MEVTRTWVATFRAFCLGLILGVLSVYLVLSVYAESAALRPDGNGTTLAGTAVGCDGSLRWECLNDDVTAPAAPTDTSSDYLDMTNNQINFSTLQSVTDVETATSATIYVYHRNTASNAYLRVGLFAANETTQYGSTDFGSQTSSGWSSTTYTGLNLNQAAVDDLRLRLECDKIGGGSTNNCYIYAAYVVVNFSPVIEVTVGSTGSQQNLDIGTTSAHVGGAFSIVETDSNRDVTSVTIRENGSIDAANDLKNVRLYYDLDTTGADGYDCSSETFNGDEPQYGATSTNGFSSADGTITFTQTVGISTTQSLCLYPVLDVATTSSPGDEIELQIDNPSVNVSATGADLDIEPSTAVALSGTTVIQAQDRTQYDYHWRNDVGGEGASNSATGGNSSTTLNALGIGQPVRLRLGVSNNGNRTSDATQYRLEYVQKSTQCSEETGWTDVNATDDDINMYNTTNLNNGDDTTNVALADGGVTNENTTFLTPNGGVRTTESETGSITLTSSEYVELEYSIIASTTATAGNQYCFRVTDLGTPIETYAEYPEATILADITVGSVGTLRSTVDIPTADVNAGAYFRIIDNIAGDTTVQSIKVTASGTLSVNSDITDVALWYDLDTTGADNYNCSDQSFNGNETQFGATSTSGFTSNTATFSDTQVVNTTQSMCIYVVYSASSTISDAEQLDLRIQNATTDVTIDSGTIAPAALVDLAGVTTFVTANSRQVHYHWREDIGGEGASNSATGDEDTPLENLRRTSPIRLRIGMANEGSSSTPSYQYRLEWGLKVSSCAVASYVDVGATDDEFNMYDSANLTDGDDTTNLATSSGGVTDVGATFFSNNNAVKDTSSQTGGISLPGKNFTDLEFAITASTTATEGATYCFRVTDAGDDTVLDYSVYPEVTIKPKTDFFIQRNTVDVSGTSVTLTAGQDYLEPSSSTTAFVRIVGTNNTGAGSTAGTGSADDTTVYIAPGDITSSITFTRPATAADTTRVAWEIIEYIGAPGGDNEINVREQGTVTYGTAAATASTAAVPGVVDGDDVAVFITGHGNPDTGTNYPTSLSTANFSSSTNIATFTRGATGNASVVSYAVVEFVGDNWKVQRSEHTYSLGGTTEFDTSITAVNSVTRAFIHTQKRVGSGLTNHADFGHTVWLSGVKRVSYAIESTASTPGSHTSVAWIIENVQSVGDTMIVSRSSNSESAGTSPKTVTNNIGKTISDTQDASLFINNSGNEAGGGGDQNSFPEPIISAEIISETQHQYVVTQTGGDSRTWRAEVVEWPTAARDIVQNDFYFFVDNDALTPDDPWPAGPGDVGENGGVGVNNNPIALYENFRLRMTLQISAAAMEPGIDAFKLQYGEFESSCSALSESQWHDVGGIGSTTALWRGTTTSETDGTALSTDPPTPTELLIAASDVAGTFEEQNPSAFTPFAVDPGEDVEFDWVVQHNGAKEKTTYCFRMVESTGTLLDDWLTYPTMRTAGYTPRLETWRWYDDETSLTPTTSLAAENTAPTGIANDNIIKLRTTLAEVTGGEGTDVKFKLQYSQDPNFSDNVFDVVGTSTCTATSTWCYADGAGVDNGIIDSAVLSDADTCVAGSGNGCGTYNEGTATGTATLDQAAYATTEFEFTIKSAAPRAGSVYYFRLFDVQNATSVVASTTFPSVLTESGTLVFGLSGLPAGTFTEGTTTDVATTPNSIPFGELGWDTDYKAAYRLTLDTNATEGYQVFMYATQDMLDPFGNRILPITGSNASPVTWGSGCAASAMSCIGYHAGDDSLFGGSTRFSPNNTYAQLSSTTLEEVAYSGLPAVSETTDIIFQIRISDQQPAGQYQQEVIFVSVPIY